MSDHVVYNVRDGEFCLMADADSVNLEPAIEALPEGVGIE